MTKGIIVLDDIQVICAECNFATITPNKECLRCEAKNRIIYNAKPDWCPVQEMPKRRIGYLIDTERNRDNYKHGWNDCLNKIEGRCDMEQCCGTCKFHRTDDNGDWVCTNDISEYYAIETDYSDVCVDWTGRDEIE